MSLLKCLNKPTYTDPASGGLFNVFYLQLMFVFIKMSFIRVITHGWTEQLTHCDVSSIISLFWFWITVWKIISLSASVVCVCIGVLSWSVTSSITGSMWNQ